MATKIETTETKIDAMTTVGLRKMAAALGIKGMSSARKADLVTAIAAKEAEKADAAEKAAEEELREAAREHDAAAEKISAELDAQAKQTEVFKEIAKRHNPSEVTEIENPKAARFAADAVTAGWKVGSATVNGETTTLIVLGGGEVWLEISWDGPRCQNDGTSYKAADGKVRKVRNASAARKILDA